MDRPAPPGRSDRGLRPRGRRAWLGIAILSAWLVGWAFGEWQAVHRLFFSDEPGGAAWFLGVWLVAWTVGGLLALRALWRLLRGEEPPPSGPAEPPSYTDAG
ncbi:MAG: hypothetical protein HZB56_12015 [Deltaproteobacteria bacterium]|nr:hypothetical protein [Deltaproteobacteria bacterium]